MNAIKTLACSGHLNFFRHPANLYTQGVRTMASACTTEKTYYQNTYLASVNADILSYGSDDGGFFVVPSKTVFHPQGGGQPADSGTITTPSKSYEVVRLKEVDGEIRHYIDSHEDFDASATLTIDIAKRTLYAKLHSAGHLLANIAEESYPGLEGFQGNHFPGGQAFVRFKGPNKLDKEAFKKTVESRLAEIIAEKRAAIVNNESAPRTVQFEGFKQYPCGGTHVRNTEELGAVTIRSVRYEKDILKVGYTVQGQ